MAKYSRHQRKMINLGLGLSQGYSPKIRKALLAAMAVESGFKNLNYGDRDSQGVLQQRPSTGWGPPGNPRRDIKQFLRAAKTQSKGGFQGGFGQLAQAVQRSAFPERYAERGQQVSKLLAQGGGTQVVGNMGGNGGGAGGGAGGAGRTAFATGLMARVSGDPNAPGLMDLVGMLDDPATNAPADESGGGGGPVTSPGGVIGKYKDLGGVAAHTAKAQNRIWQNMNAADLGAKAGTPVYAAASGRIGPGFGSSSGPGIYGKRLTVVGKSNEFFYTHLGRYAKGVRPGKRVKKGQLLGYVGKGQGYPTHLHFAVRHGDPYRWT